MVTKDRKVIEDDRSDERLHCESCSHSGLFTNNDDNGSEISRLWFEPQAAHETPVNRTRPWAGFVEMIL